MNLFCPFCGSHFIYYVHYCFTFQSFRYLLHMTLGCIYVMYPIWASNRNSLTYIYSFLSIIYIVKHHILIPIYIIHGYEFNDNHSKNPKVYGRNSFHIEATVKSIRKGKPKATSFPLIIIWKNYDDGNSLCWNELCILGMYWHW